MFTCEITSKLTLHGLVKTLGTISATFTKNQAAFDLGAGVPTAGRAGSDRDRSPTGLGTKRYEYHRPYPGDRGDVSFPHGVYRLEAAPTTWGDRGFESAFLRRRVHEPSVPAGRPLFGSGFGVGKLGLELVDLINDASIRRAV